MIEHILNSSAPAQNTDEWLQWRCNKLTASDSHVVAGNGVKGRERLLLEKTGFSHRTFQGNAFTEAGHVNEPVAIEAYVRQRGMPVHTGLRPVCHPVYTDLAASLDGVTPDGCVIEVKCLQAAVPLKKAKPVHVQQVQFQMFCTGLVKAHLLYYYLNQPGQGEERCYLQVHELHYNPESIALSKFLAFVEELKQRQQCQFTLPLCHLNTDNIVLESEFKFCLSQVLTEWLQYQGALNDGHSEPTMDGLDSIELRQRQDTSGQVDTVQKVIAKIDCEDMVTCAVTDLTQSSDFTSNPFELLRDFAAASGMFC